MIPFAWALVALLMGQSWSSDPYDPGLTGTSAYGHNGEGALSTGLRLTGIEALVLQGALRPWSYSAKQWWRPLLVLPLAIPWTLLSAVLTMHAGGIIAIHLLWLLLVCVGLVLATIVGVIARARLPREPSGRTTAG